MYKRQLYHYAVLIDSLGHGKVSYAMSEIIRDKLVRCWSSNPSNIILDINTNLDNTIGAAIGALVINKNTMKFLYSGLGNIRCKVIGQEGVRNLTSSDGILGMRYRSTKNQNGILGSGDMVLLYSDGVNGLDNFQYWNKFGSLKCTTIVRRIVNQFGTDFDDSSCIAIKIN